jgi:hypothetical protein
MLGGRDIRWEVVERGLEIVGYVLLYYCWLLESVGRKCR